MLRFLHDNLELRSINLGLMKSQSHLTLESFAPLTQALTLALTLSLMACGGTPPVRSGVDNSSAVPAGDVPYEVVEDYNSGVIRYTVQRGDSLGDIAQEYTGASQTWRDIAEFNGIDNPRQLREGMILEIPTGLIPGYVAPAAAPPIIETQSQSVAQTSSLAVRRDNAAEVAPVVVTPIESNRDFELNPIQAGNNQPQSAVGGGQQIKVIGSYYPKGIYTEPAPYSKLIMRVAPGAKFSVTDEVNGWYRIDTQSGTGYIRTTDAEIIE